MQLSRDFETFIGGPTADARHRLHITINRGGVIYFNQNAYQALGKPQGVTLHFSREKDVIAVQPSNVRSAISFPVVQKRVGWRINASPFCRHFRIKPSSTERFIEPEVASDGILYLKLSKTVSIAGTPRKKK